MRTSRQPTLPALFLLGSALSTACVSLPRPVAADVVTARSRYPSASLASLEAGRQAFVDSCAGCHALPQPNKKTPEEWPKILDEMAVEAKLDPVRIELITQFLVTMSVRGNVERVKKQ